MLLEKAGIEGPYVLAGASLGGLNVQVFASHYPEIVAGLVLTDPAPLDHITGKAFPELIRIIDPDAVESEGQLDAAAGVVTTVRDLAKFDVAMDRNQIATGSNPDPAGQQRGHKRTL
jgi:pimeloyl-ACP methyl ester carboxylesterase